MFSKLHTLRRKVALRVRSSSSLYTEITHVIAALRTLSLAAPRRLRDVRSYEWRVFRTYEDLLKEIDAAIIDCDGVRELEEEVFKTFFLKYRGDRRSVGTPTARRVRAFKKRLKQYELPPLTSVSEPIKIIAGYIRSKTALHKSMREELRESRDRRLRQELLSSEANLTALLGVFKP